MTGPRKRPALWVRYLDASSVGLEMGLSVAVGVGAGIYLERNVTHLAPWTSLAGLAVGLGAAVLSVVRAARRVRKDAAAAAPPRTEPRPAAPEAERRPGADTPRDRSGAPPG